MPIEAPTLDDRRYQQILNEALARIPVHNPEWTNFNKSDPGVTLLELLAFYLESLFYRCNQIPDRLRLRHLSLLRIGLLPAAPATGIVTIANESGPLETETLSSDLEVVAGSVPFRTTMGLDVLPIEARAYSKLTLEQQSDDLKAYYSDLYASYGVQQPGAGFQLYETRPFPDPEGEPLDLGDTVDGLLWLAILTREGETIEDARQRIGGKILNLGCVPSLEASEVTLRAGRAAAETTNRLGFEIPDVADDGLLPSDPALRTPRYRSLESSSTVDVLLEPGVVQVTLPESSALRLWSNVDPLEAGTAEFPPDLADEALAERLITWIRVRPDQKAGAVLSWMGINAVPVTQRLRVAGERLPDGTGEPDQEATLTRGSIVDGSVSLRVTTSEGITEWEEVEDLLGAGPEIPVPDLRQPPGTRTAAPPSSEAFALDREAGKIRFGDGVHGRRPPPGARIEVDYDYTAGPDGNVGAETIKSGASLPAGFKVSNPVPTWGGVAAQDVDEGEQQIAQLLQNRDRLVTEEDFRTIASRAPGADVGRVEVLSAWTTEIPDALPGEVPGAVTVMVIPRSDPDHPGFPVPDRPFLDAVCRHLDPRRLVTTEVILTGPEYVPVWISVGFEPVPGASEAEVRERVRGAVIAFLSPLPPAEETDLGGLAAGEDYRGWPLAKPVNALEIAAYISRQQDVLLVRDVLLSDGASTESVDKIEVTGLRLPRIGGLRVSAGEAAPLTELLEPAEPTTGTDGSLFVPVPFVPEEC